MEKTLEEYQAVRDAVGFLDLSDRGKIEVTGPDRITFLHSMISNDVKELPEWPRLAGQKRREGTDDEKSDLASHQIV